MLAAYPVFGKVGSTTYRVALQLAICADVEEPARRIVGAGAKGVAVGEELDGVDVGVVRCERLAAFLLSDVPQLGEGVAGSRHELVVIQRVYAQAHDVSKVICEFGDLLAGFNVPQHAGHVAG